MSTDTISCVVGDDHDLLRKGLTTYLGTLEDVRVVGEAATGQSTLAMVQRRLPDTLLLDVHMSDLDGLAICREIHARGLPTKVVLYTGDGDVAVLDEALEAGASGFVVKSGPMEDIVQAMRFAVAGEVYIDSSLGAALLRRRADRQHQVLSARESEVVTLLADGKTTDETARSLFLSPATVRSYAESAMHKVDARNRAHLVAKSLRMGLLT